MSEDINEDRSRALDRPHQYPLTSPQPLYYPPESEEEVHLKDYLHVILKRKWIIITFLVVIVTSATIASFMMKPKYKSTITIKIEAENPKILAFEDVVGIEKADQDYYQTQYKILKSRNLAKRVIRSLKLDTNAEFVANLQNKNNKAKTDALAKQYKLLDDDGISPGIVNSFLDRIDVEPVPKSRLVNVSFTSYNPELSASVANAIGDSFIGLNIESKFEATYQARIWLEKQLEVMKGKVEQTEESLNKYAARNEIIFVSKTEDGGEGGENIITKKLSELSTELTDATAERIKTEALYREVISGDPESSSVVMNNEMVSSLRKELAGLESEYSKQSKTYKPGYPQMVKLKEHINKVSDKMEQEIKRVVLSIKKDYEVALNRENQLKSAFESQKKEALSLNQRSVQYQILKRETDTNKELYNGLLQRLKETDVSGTLTASNIQVLDKAEVPKKPFKPNKGKNILLSIIVGLLGGVGLAFFAEYLDRTIKTPEDVEKKVSLPPLGLVPSYSDKSENFPVECIAHLDGRSPISEAYRSIRTFLLLSTGGKPPRVIMVTSAAGSEGKTTTAINTAISLTKSDVKAVVIDGDMRKSRLHNIFGLDNTVGLSTFLSGNAEFGNGMIKTTDIQNLDIITAGPVPPNPAELLGSYRLSELIQNLYQMYNFIVIDAPPVLGIADPLIISQHTDGVMMVVRSGSTQKEAAREARRLLMSVNAKILGVVLNSLDQSAMRYSHYYNYYRYYYSNENK